MNKTRLFFQSFFVPIIFWVSVLCFTIWLTRYSGVIWTPDKLAASSVKALTEAAKNWGPMFAPSAAIIFIVSLLRKSLLHEIKNQLSPQITRDVREAVSFGLLSRMQGVSSRHTLQGIKSIYFGLRDYKRFNSNDIERMQRRSVIDFKSSLIDNP